MITSELEKFQDPEAIGKRTCLWCGQYYEYRKQDTNKKFCSKECAGHSTMARKLGKEPYPYKDQLKDLNFKVPDKPTIPNFLELTPEERRECLAQAALGNAFFWLQNPNCPAVVVPQLIAEMRKTEEWMTKNHVGEPDLFEEIKVLAIEEDPTSKSKRSDELDNI